MLRAVNVEAAARRQTRLAADPRASHFSDSDARLGNRYGPIIHLPEGVPAWDVYFIFGPGVHWDATPPAPTYWMHQLGRSAPAELRLDGKQLALVINGLLGKTEKSPVGSAMNQPLPRLRNGGRFTVLNLWAAISAPEVASRIRPVHLMANAARGSPSGRSLVQYLWNRFFRID